MQPQEDNVERFVISPSAEVVNVSLDKIEQGQKEGLLTQVILEEVGQEEATSPRAGPSGRVTRSSVARSEAREESDSEVSVAGSTVEITAMTEDRENRSGGVYAPRCEPISEEDGLDDSFKDPDYPADIDGAESYSESEEYEERKAREVVKRKRAAPTENSPNPKRSKTAASSKPKLVVGVKVKAEMKVTPFEVNVPELNYPMVPFAAPEQGSYSLPGLRQIKFKFQLKLIWHIDYKFYGTHPSDCR